MEWLRWILLLVGIALIGAIYWTGRRRERARDETLLERARRDDEAGHPANPVPPPGPDLDITDDLDDLEIEVPASPPGGPGYFPPDAPDSATARGGSPPVPAADGPADTAGEPPRNTADVPPAASPGPEPVDRTGAAEPAPASAGRPAARDRTGSTSEAPSDERIVVLYVVAPGGERLVGERLRDAFQAEGLEHGELDVFHGRDPEGHTLFSVANVLEPGTFDPATMGTLTTPGVAMFLRLPGPPSAERAFEQMVAVARGLAESLEARVLDERHSTLTRQTEQHLRDEMREIDHRRSRTRR